MDNPTLARKILTVASLLCLAAGALGLAMIWFGDVYTPTIRPSVLALMCAVGMAGLAFLSMQKKP